MQFIYLKQIYFFYVFVFPYSFVSLLILLIMLAFISDFDSYFYYYISPPILTFMFLSLNVFFPPVYISLLSALFLRPTFACVLVSFTSFIFHTAFDSVCNLLCIGISFSLFFRLVLFSVFDFRHVRKIANSYC